MRSHTRPSENTNKERAWGDEANFYIGLVGSKVIHKMSPRPLGFERAWYAKIRHVMSLSTSVGVSMETLTSFQSAHGQVAV